MSSTAIAVLEAVAAMYQKDPNLYALSASPPPGVGSSSVVGAAEELVKGGYIEYGLPTGAPQSNFKTWPIRVTEKGWLLIRNLNAQEER